MPYTANKKSSFPELTHTKHQPSAKSFKSSDPDSEPAYIGSSGSLGADFGHVSSSNERMNDPFSDPYDYNQEPKGSAPGSGEGINAASKPEGKGLECDDLADYF